LWTSFLVDVPSTRSGQTEAARDRCGFVTNTHKSSIVFMIRFRLDPDSDDEFEDDDDDEFSDDSDDRDSDGEDEDEDDEEDDEDEEPETWQVSGKARPAKS
jgi:hypothetical protein